MRFRGPQAPKDMKDSLWSMDLFRCESATLRTHWVLVVMDQYTRRIIGFGVHAGSVDGVALCRMFNRAIRGQRWMSKYLSSDNDPLYRFHQWQANLRVLELTEIKSIPYVPLSHPLVERLIGTLRREYLDHLLFWTTTDLETSCSISGPTLTTIARIPHGKGERRIRPCHDQSQISARLDGSPIVDPYFRRQWLPNFQIFELTVVSGQAPQKPGMKSCGVCALGCSAFRGSDRFTVTRSVQKGRGISLSRRDLPVISALVSIRQRQVMRASRTLTPTDSCPENTRKDCKFANPSWFVLVPVGSSLGIGQA